MVTRRILGTLFSFGSVGAVLLGCNAIWGIEEPNPTLLGADGGGTVNPGDSSTNADQRVPGTDGTTPGSGCDIGRQTGCAPNETCAPQDDKGTTSRCVPAGADPAGHGCDSEANCAPGHVCRFGACHKACFHSNSSLVCADGTVCLKFDLDTEVGTPSPGTCLVPCVPDDPEGCGGLPTTGPVAGCQLIAADVTTCARGARTRPPACESLSTTEDKACPRGETCAGPSTATIRCRQWCRVGTSCADTGKACVGYTDPLTLDGETWGACPD